MKRIPVAILGATGAVGQKFIRLLRNHPQFVCAELVASERSAGKSYLEACNWIEDIAIPDEIATTVVKGTQDALESRLLFSGLDSSVAGDLEQAYAQKGHIVISNASAHRMDPSIPLIIPEVNLDHISLIETQKTTGKIITNSNCVTMFLAMVCAPIHEALEITQLHISTMQAVSGAGYPGVASLDILDNVIPYIPTEEEKLSREPLRILGNLQNNRVEPAQFPISAQCNRVPILNGHVMTVTMAVKNKISIEALTTLLRDFRGYPQEQGLHSAPKHPIIVYTDPFSPQIRKCISHEMSASVGRIRNCPILDYRMVIAGHNTVRGAAGAAILNAEAYLAKGYTL